MGKVRGLYVAAKGPTPIFAILLAIDLRLLQNFKLLEQTNWLA
jgi:hypothetical protein